MAQNQIQPELELIADLNSLGLWNWDISTGSLFLNERFLEALDLIPSAFNGRYETFLRWIVPSDLASFEQAVKFHLVEGIPFDVQVRLQIAKDSPIRQFDFKAATTRDHEGSALKMIGVLSGEGLGISSESGIQSIIADHQNLMIQGARMAALGEMASGIAHEINNPLAIIVGKSAQLKRKVASKDLDPEKFTIELTKIEDTAFRIAKIVKGLRAFARNSKNDPMEKTLVAQIIDDTLALCQEKFKQHAIELKVNLGSFSEISIDCRPSQLSQVLLNLLNNAYDAVEVLPEKWVEISTVSIGENIAIRVTDSGNGIPPAILSKLMQPFFTTKEVGKGTGLGLSISKGIIDDHHGRFYYDHDSPRTRFVVELPLVQPQI